MLPVKILMHKSAQRGEKPASALAPVCEVKLVDTVVIHAPVACQSI